MKKAKDNLLLENPGIHHRYEILDTYEAGISLLGSEVKSLKNKRGSIREAYAIFRDGELFLIGMQIDPYPPAGKWNHEGKRSRKLLLKRKELDKLRGLLSRKGYTLVPYKVYTNSRGWIKVLLALVKAKRKIDRRREIKEREIKRELERARKYYNF